MAPKPAEPLPREEQPVVSIVKQLGWSSYRVLIF